MLKVLLLVENMTRIHGIDERIGKEDFLRGITFYYHLIRNIEAP